MALQVADRRAVALPALPRPIFDADDRCRRLGRLGPPAQDAQQGVAADGQQQPGREASAGTAAKDQAEVMRQRSSLDVRRAKRAAISGSRRSAKIRAGQPALAQRNRRTDADSQRTT